MTNTPSNKNQSEIETERYALWFVMIFSFLMGLIWGYLIWG
jgi:hypothetical protein